MRKYTYFFFNSRYSYLSRYFEQHADGRINVSQVALALCEIRLISAIIISKFMSILFFLGGGVKKNISKSENR